MTALPGIVDELFRHRYGRLVAGLCRVLGPGRLDLVEDVLQEALLRALRVWPTAGVPDNPEAWVFRSARNLAVDALRRRKIADRVEDELQRWAKEDTPGDPVGEAPAVADDTLRLLFLCAHPAVPADSRVPLLLKTVCGFGVPEIARALLQKEATIAQRLVRSKAKLQGGDVAFEMPAANALHERLDAVLAVVYLVFNEGYRAHLGEDLVRDELVGEAVRLGLLLLELPETTTGEVHALLSLMLLLGARCPARADRSGDLMTLAEQDRSLWDRRWLAAGFFHLRASLGGDVMTAFHCEAAIASVHAAAASYEATDWPRILREYDRLMAIAPSPVVRLNRAVALGKVHGLAAALAELHALDDDGSLRDYFLLPATIAHLSWANGARDTAARAFATALDLPCSDPERRLLQRRLDACRRGDPPAPW
jgi:RNA polymerase sigma-70 factor (ECF subfamily)